MKNGRLANDLPCPPDTQATRRSEWHARLRSSTRRLPSLDAMQASLTSLEKRHEQLYSREMSTMSEELRAASSR